MKNLFDSDNGKQYHVNIAVVVVVVVVVVVFVVVSDIVEVTFDVVLVVDLLSVLPSLSVVLGIGGAIVVASGVLFWCVLLVVFASADFCRLAVVSVLVVSS